MKMRLDMLMLVMLVGAGEMHAREFYVRDYGAVGDGTTDDGPAIRKAVAAAVAASPGAKVIFDACRYRLARAAVDYHIALKQVKGLTIEGNGAELINNPWNNIVRLDKCEDVTVRGFVVDCDPLPFTQGTITEVDAEAGAFLLEIHHGYDNPVVVYRRIGNTKPNWGWGVCMDPQERKRKPAAIMHFHIDSVTEVGVLLRVVLAKEARKHAAELGKGDRFVITLKYGGHGASFAVTRSRNCRLENNTIYTAKYGMTHSLSDNRGRIHVKRVKITFNNVFRAQRRHALLARTSGGVFEGNLVDGVGGNGVALNNEIGSFYEGPLPRDTVIRDNTFRNTFWDAIKVYTNGKGAEAKNITITGNRITGWHTDPKAREKAAISLRNVAGGEVKGNTIGPAAGGGANDAAILLENCRDVIQHENVLTDEQ